jgi:DNA-binding MarR family transcriptional regulator
MQTDLQAELKQNRPFKSPLEEAFVALQRTAAVLEHALETTLKPSGITATQYNVLRILRGAGPEGLCRNEIRDRMVTPVPDVTRLLDRLEALRLIVRARGLVDRRQMTTRITKDGLKLLDRLDQPVVEMHERLMGHVGEQRMRTLLALLAAVRRAP